MLLSKMIIMSLKAVNKFINIKWWILFAISTNLFSHAIAQSQNDIVLGLTTDLIKSNNSGYFERYQTSLEGNYFFLRKISGTIGIEYWTESRELSGVAGVRWYPVPYAFVRARGLVGANDFSFGGGWSKPLNQNWQFEAMGDFYSNATIAIRAGFTYIIPK